MLTQREREIILFAANGHSNEAIARKLFLSRKTVIDNLGRIFRKYGVHDRTAAVAQALVRSDILLTEVEVTVPELTKSLTNRELEALVLWERYKSIPLVAEQLRLAKTTVENYLNTSKKKLGAEQFTEAVKVAKLQHPEYFKSRLYT